MCGDSLGRTDDTMSGYNPGGPQDPSGEYGLTPQGSTGGYESVPGAPQGGYEQGGGFDQSGPSYLAPGQQGHQSAGGYAGQAAPPNQGPPQGYQGPPQGYQGPPQGYQNPPPYGQQGYPGQPPFGTPPKKKSSAGLILGIVGGVVALLLIAGVGGYFVIVNSRPDSMVKEYFEALAAGDAEKALSFAANDPSDPTLLTDEVLEASNALATITDVTITNRTERTVRVSYRIGGELDSVNYEVTKTSDGWKMREVAFPIGVVAGVKNVPAVINGVKVADVEKALVFPGTYEFATSSKHLAWTEPQQTLRGGTLQVPISTRVELTDGGEDAARQAIRDRWDTCMKKRELKPKGCPFQLASLNGTVDKSTIRWSADPHPAKTWVIMPLRDATRLEGRAVYGLRLAFDYSSGSNKYHYDRTVSLSLNIYLDMTQKKPEVHWET